MPRLLLLAFAAVALAFGPGCKSKCRALSEKLCDCEDNSVEKDACVRRAGSEEGRVSPTAEDEAVCEALLEKCDCQLIETADGKRNCGLAR